jgi:hypothetical protein
MLILFPQSCTTQSLQCNSSQKKTKAINIDTPLMNEFFLTIDICECLHKQANMFLHNYVNAI